MLERFKEKPLGFGTANDGNFYQLVVNAQDRDWTLLLVEPEHTCIAYFGKYWQPMPDGGALAMAGTANARVLTSASLRIKPDRTWVFHRNGAAVLRGTDWQTGALGVPEPVGLRV